MRFIVFRNPRLDFLVLYDRTPAHEAAGCKKKDVVVDIAILDELEYDGPDDVFNKRVAPRLHPNTARALRKRVEESEKKQRNPSIRSKKRVEFIDGSHKLGDQISGDRVMWEPVRSIRVREGTIVYHQGWDGESGRPFGLVLGFIASHWRKRRGRRIAMINPLTKVGRQKYTKKFSKLLKGPLNFW